MGSTFGCWLMTRDTVPTETRARRATSVIETSPLPCRSRMPAISLLRSPISEHYTILPNDLRAIALVCHAPLPMVFVDRNVARVHGRIIHLQVFPLDVV